MGRIHTQISQSDEGQYLMATSIAYLKKLPTFTCDIESCGKFWMKIQVVKVDLGGKEYWADKVTGSLYDTQTLHCLSSRLRISSKVVPAKGKKVEVAHG